MAVDRKRLQEEYRRIYSVVKVQLDDFDAYDLLAGGCPGDEFEQEAQMIASRLRHGMTALQIANIMAEVMNKQFEPVFVPQDFLPFAGKIGRALHETEHI